MIIRTSSGVLIQGTLAKDPAVKDVGQKQVLKFDLKAHSVKDETGKWNSTYVQVNLWHGIEQWDGMLLKGDSVTVCARELKQHESNGKTYLSVDVDDITPGGLVIQRWMQMVIDMMAQPSTSPELTPTDETTPFDEPPPQPTQTVLDGARMYPGESLSDYAPRGDSQPAAGTPEAERLIEEDADDLPF